jgi:Cu(I)/Ag(I) efflux system membrane fusion protein
MNKFILTTAALMIGAAGGYYLPGQLNPAGEMGSGAKDPNEPLYWVAPMDPNYKRDKPGLSPMGMDLVPVYEEDLAGGDSPGTVSIDPVVENNLGVRTAPVWFSPLQANISTVGYVGYDEEQQQDVHSRIAGWLEVLHVKADGEFVEKGALLYEIYSPELVTAQEEYLTAVRSGNRYLRKASAEKLVALGVPEAVISQLRKTGKALKSIPFYAPRAGYVSMLNVRQGMYIKPATRVMRIGALDQVWVIAELFERQAAQIREGDSARMQLDFQPGRFWGGNVDYIYPSLNEKTRTLRVRLRFDNPDMELKPGMFARVDLLAQPTGEVLNIPSSALIETGDSQRAVVALGEGKYKSVEVKTGARIGERVAILDGLYPEDRVVTSAQFMLDSESAISSDFLRMTPPMMGLIEETWAQAEVRELDSDSRKVVIKHASIRMWKQPEMVMEVPVDDAVDFNLLQPGNKVQVLLNGADMGELKITDVILPQPKAPREGGAM